MTGMLTDYPHLVEQWHPTKNSDIAIESLKKSSGKKVWWLGPCGHEWDMDITSRCDQNQKCPLCSGKRIVAGINDLATLRPDIAAQWHPTKNDDLLPSQVSEGSGKKVWWLGKCSHEWNSIIHTRTGLGHGCPVCSGRTVLAGFNDLATLRPDIAAQWHPTKNPDFTPQTVSYSSGRKAWWLCSLGHEWDARIADRAKGIGCSICAGQKILTGYNDLATLRPAIAAEWNYEKNSHLPSPDTLSIGSAKVAWWKCKVGHEWEVSIKCRASNNRRCPYCSNQKILAGYNDLPTKNPALAKEWHPTLNNKQASSVAPNTNKKAWWLCSSGHEYFARIADRNFNKSGCPQCYAARTVSLAEQELYEYLVKTTGLDIKQSDRTMLKPLELDMYIPALNIAIEFNGVYWHSEATGKDKSYHQNKWLACQARGIELLQVWCEDYEKKPDVVKAMILRKLGFDVSGKPSFSVAMNAKDVSVVEVSEAAAKTYFGKTSFLKFEAADKHFGLRMSGSKKLVGLLSVVVEDDRIHVIQFSADVLGHEVLDVLVRHTLSVVDVKTVEARLDNCFANFASFAACGFAVDEVLPADFVYLHHGNRIAQSEYDVQRFMSDPKLVFLEGKTLVELADMNGLNRLWNAGYTVMVKTVG